MGKIKVVLDTNILLDNSDILNEVDKYDFVLPYVVLMELDKKKFDQNLSYPARTAIKKIWAGIQENTITVTNVPTNLETNDERIVAAAKESGSAFLTNDIGAKVVAIANGVELLDVDNMDAEWDKSYKGYKEIEIDHLYFSNTLMHNRAPYMYDEFIELINCQITDGNLVYSIEQNEYIIVYPSIRYDDKSIIFKRTDSEIQRVGNSNKYLKDMGLPIRFLHPEQAIAFDMIFSTDTPLTVIQGAIGSGKTLMSIVAALARTRGVAGRTNAIYNKVYVTRPPIPVDRNLAIGFLPGDLNAKMGNWLAGFLTNLKFLFETTEADSLNKRASKIFEDSFEAVSLESIQGASFNDSILILDESQLLSMTALKQVMSRIATGSKLVILLDPKQTYGANSGHEGYKKLLPQCKGNELITFINLQHIQRSELTKLVDRIFG